MPLMAPGWGKRMWKGVMNNNKVKSVLVTGGGGFIGSHTVEALLYAGLRVRVLDNFSSGKRTNLPRAQSGLEVLEGDIRDYPAVLVAMSDIDACIHLAAQVSVTASIENPPHSALHNILGFLHILQAARARQVTRLVYASSVAVYGDSTELPITETTPRQPISPYGLDKRVNEDYANLYHDLYGLNTLGLRYFNVYGPRQDPQTPYAGVIARFVNDIGCGKPLTVYGDGHQSRDFIFVKDIAQANVAALNSSAEGIINVGTGKRITLLELISTLEHVTGQQTDIDFHPPQNGDIRHSFGDTSRMTEVLNFTPQWTLRDGLHELIAKTGSSLTA